MILTVEQRKAVEYHDNLMLAACPGSGKTRVIISKLSRLLDEVRHTSRMVGCVTYTNSAVHEIEGRLRQNVQPGDEINYDICTIHSFCLNYIFRPFCHLINGYKKGFSVLTPESDEYEKFASIIFSKMGIQQPSHIEILSLSELRVTLAGQPTGNPIERGLLTPEIALEYWLMIKAKGYVDFSNIIYYSLLLLRENQYILSYLSAKFAWILVDEFQDTTDLQVEILSLIAGVNRTKLMLVGDPHQSIFRFAGARPDLAENFAAKINARTDISLTVNFRSSQPIIELAQVLIPRSPVMSAKGSSIKFTEKPRWIHGANLFEVITDHFLPAIEGLDIPLGDSAILAPTWFSLFPLGRMLREYGVRIVGPGARPYRRNIYFAPLAEQICGYLVDRRPESIASIERTIFNTILDLTGRSYYDLFSYKGRVIVYRLLQHADSLAKLFSGGVDWLEEAAKAFANVLFYEEYLTTNEKNKLVLSVEEMKRDMLRNRVDTQNLTIEDLGIYASPHSALKLASLHFSKGHEYMAVAMIDLHEGRIPFYQSQTVDDIEEAKRLFYVGMTRAKRLLLFITDDSGKRNGPSRFLCNGTGIGICDS